MIYVIQLASRIKTELVLSWSCSQAVSWHVPLLCVQWKTPDDGQRNCPKHVEFYSKNKFEKLVHLIGFIIKIYHDTRSPGRQYGPYLSSSCRHVCSVISYTAHLSLSFCLVVFLLTKCLPLTQQKFVTVLRKINCYIVVQTLSVPVYLSNFSALVTQNVLWLILPTQPSCEFFWVG